MAIFNVTKVRPDQFPADTQKWISRLISPINDTIDQVKRALTNQLTFAANFDGTLTTLEVDGTFPASFAWSPKNKPGAAWIAGITRVDGAAVSLAGAISLVWDYSANARSFRVLAIPGLSASSSNKYLITIVAVSG